MSTGNKVIVTPGQTWIDIAIQHTGSVEGLQDIMELNRPGELDTVFSSGEEVNVGEVIDQEAVLALSRAGVVPKTNLIT